VSTDLTDVYFDTAMAMLSLDPDIMVADAPAAKIPAKIRLGNIKARLRMITLYNLASMHNGLVASTDNFSELAAGFWTLHGDVGDVAPIQSLTKSWEVPVIAEALSLPESVVYATPTDGLGIDTGDEAQFGYTYAQADLFVLDLINNTASPFDMNKDDQRVVSAIKERLKNSAFKRANPSNIGHPITGHKRYNRLEYLDKTLTL
jgi:nicotinamide-nucleotide amidase